MEITKSKNRYLDILIAFGLMLVFVLITVQGLDNGLPEIGGTDVLAHRVMSALAGEWEFDSINFDYPSLPKYVMFWVGRLVFSMGYGNWEVVWAMRFVSVLLGAGLVGLAYSIARMLGRNRMGAVIASLLVMTSSRLAQNARFAHNDVYLAFFIGLTTVALIWFTRKRGRWVFYWVCFIVGLAASSKYNGGVVILAPVLLYLVFNRATLIKELGRHLEELFGAGLVTFGGYALGTPKALLWMAFYFKRVVPSLIRTANYDQQPGSVRGVIGQWSLLIDMLTPYWSGVLLVVFGFTFYWLIKNWKEQAVRPEWWGLISVLLILGLYDLPIMYSYNYRPRFMLAMLPLLAGLTGWALSVWQTWLRKQSYAWLGYLVPLLLIPSILIGAARVYGVMLLYENDARDPARDFVAGLESPTASIEFTYYAPAVDREAFERAHNYPLIFLSIPDQELPTSPYFEYNTGAVGIEDRQTTYLMIDSFTYARFNNEYICSIHPADCEFILALLAGETNYEEIATFEYTLPAWIPETQLDYFNPVIKVYQRVANKGE